jgi:hypothetical protein
VSANLEIWHRESVQKKNGCTARPQRSQQSKACVAGDCRLQQFLDDVRIQGATSVLILSSAMPTESARTMIFARDNLG